MTKKDLIKEILTLGQELDKATGLDVLMIIDEMEKAIDKYQDVEEPMEAEGDVRNSLTVKVKKEELVDLYNFAYSLAKDANRVNELHEIDRIMNSNEA